MPLLVWKHISQAVQKPPDARQPRKPCSDAYSVRTLAMGLRGNKAGGGLSTACHSFKYTLGTLALTLQTSS